MHADCVMCFSTWLFNGASRTLDRNATVLTSYVRQYLGRHICYICMWCVFVSFYFAHRFPSSMWIWYFFDFNLLIWNTNFTLLLCLIPLVLFPSRYSNVHKVVMYSLVLLSLSTVFFSPFWGAVTNMKSVLSLSHNERENCTKNSNSKIDTSTHTHTSSI